MNDHPTIPASVIDVACALLEETGPVSPAKLQTLVYYAQAWNLAWDDRPMFPEAVLAARGGPVVPALESACRDLKRIRRTDLPGHPERLSEDDKETIVAVVQYYGERDDQYLSDLTHMEDPWKRTLAEAQGNRAEEIPQDRMQAYYRSL